MTKILPHRFLFRYSLPVVHISGLPRRGRALLKLPPEAALADFAELDAAQDEATPFAEIRVAWNAKGLGISVDVTGKTQPPVCDRDNPLESDGIQVWIDTRNTQTIHRASRFCHHFCLLPCGDDWDITQPAAVQLPIAQAREDAPQSATDEIAHVDWLDPANSQRSRGKRKDRHSIGASYRLEAWLPAEVLHGFEVADAAEEAEFQADAGGVDGEETSPRLGFYYCVRDRELGNQFLSVGDEFPFAHDPSLWSTLELLR